MSSGRFINVVLNVPLNQAFTYREPQPGTKGADFIPENPFGHRIEVRFGNRNMTGIVTEVFDSIPPDCAVGEEKIRHALKYSDSEPIITEELFSLAKFMSGYYIAAIGECVFSMIPSGKRESDTPGFSFLGDETNYEKKELSSEQKDAVEGILEYEPQGEKKLYHYLYGMTGSGKTEVFLSAAEKVMAEGKGVIYLVPEIGLTPQVVESVVNRFGNTAAVIHSQLTPSQRLKEWKRIIHREAKIVVGARSAVFAPVPDLGLVIIDEEHDSSYKSGSSPRYHARQIAMYRCSRLSVPLIMGSATPSVEAWHSMENGTIVRHALTRRLAGGEMPEIKCVNLSLEKNNSSCISKELEDEIRKTIEEKKQTILFLNRRGFTHFFRCASCGFELKCRNCSVSMTYHKSENRLRCHYCGYSVSPPEQCPECGSMDIGYSGFGTEYIESETKAKFPGARILRIDTDSLHHKGELQEKISAFKNGEYDIMLGTQMVAKGLNFPNLKLVGVVLADTALHLPDFRASEKTFALITQVAGRAGRYFPDGKVIVQSYSPDRDAISFAVNSDTEGFYRKEIESRGVLGFPPFSRLLRFVFRSASQPAAEKAAEDAAELLERIAAQNVQVLGPAECPLEKIALNYRHQILLRSDRMQPLLDAAKKLMWKHRAPKDVYIEVDVDPVSLL